MTELSINKTLDISPWYPFM